MNSKLTVENKVPDIDFVAVGPQRTGTTWPYEILQHHPELYLPDAVKETVFLIGATSAAWTGMRATLRPVGTVSAAGKQRRRISMIFVFPNACTALRRVLFYNKLQNGMAKNNTFDYGSDMKEYYKSDHMANEYHEAFSEQGSWRHRIIADRERKAVKTLLNRVPHGKVLDIPTGTGKLAPVFATSHSSVMACDISENMLRVAESEFTRAGHQAARFQVCDAEQIAETLNETFDVAVCLRLLHRVPSETKRTILHELGAVADHVIAPTAVESSFHKARRWVRRSLLGGDERGHCYETPKVTQDIFTDGFQIIDSKHVLPLVSQERVYLLKPDA